MRGPAVLVALLAALAGCDPRQALEQADRSPTGRYARECASLLLRNDMETLSRRFTPDVAGSATPDVLAQMQREVPEGRPPEPLVVGYESFRSPKATRESFTYEYAFAGGYLLAHVIVDSTGPTPLLAGMHVRRMPDSLVRINAFRLAGQTARHYIVLAAALLVPAFIVWALVLCARQPRSRHKWLWLAFIAVGLGSIQLNWTTGALQFRPFRLQLLGIGAWAPGAYAPWFVSVSLPVGAIVFMALHRRIGRGAQRDPASDLE